jgi:hypothetical protein
MPAIGMLAICLVCIVIVMIGIKKTVRLVEFRYYSWGARVAGGMADH